MTEMTWEAWCERLRELGKRNPFRYGEDPIAACGEECWRGYYDDEYSPEDAWYEDEINGW